MADEEMRRRAMQRARGNKPGIIQSTEENSQLYSPHVSNNNPGSRPSTGGSIGGLMTSSSGTNFNPSTTEEKIKLHGMRDIILPDGPQPVLGGLGTVGGGGGVNSVGTGGGAAALRPRTTAPPSEGISNTTTTSGEVDTVRTDVRVDTSDKRKFVYVCPPRSGMVQGYIVRDKGSMMSQPKFSYFLQRDSSFMLAAKRPTTTASPLISFDEKDLSKTSPHVTCKVKTNALGTEFTILDLSERTSQDALCPEIGAVLYEQNVIGNKGPRKMTVLLPTVDTDGRRTMFMPTKVDEGMMIDKYKKGDTSGMMILQNKQPKWNDQIRAYTLEFHGRVTRPSVKNFQLVDTTNPSRLLIQFGRVEDNKFNLDYQYPLCALQAFALAVTSLESKLACE